MLFVNCIKYLRRFFDRVAERIRHSLQCRYHKTAVIPNLGLNNKGLAPFKSLTSAKRMSYLKNSNTSSSCSSVLAYYIASKATNLGA